MYSNRCLHSGLHKASMTQRGTAVSVACRPHLARLRPFAGPFSDHHLLWQRWLRQRHRQSVPGMAPSTAAGALPLALPRPGCSAAGLQAKWSAAQRRVQHHSSPSRLRHLLGLGRHMKALLR